MPEPIFEETMGGIMVTIFRYRKSKDVVKNKEQHALQIIKENNEISAHEIAEKLNMNNRTAQRILNACKRIF